MTDPPPLIPAPSDPASWDAWRQELVQWREQTGKNYDPSPYENPAFAWARTAFAMGKVMLFDRQFFDPGRNEFTVEPWVEMMQTEFGGLDALALWQAYPRMGIDSKNQFDHYRLVPGGVRGLKRVNDRLHACGVKTFLCYNPWDTETRREPKGDLETIADLVGETGFDGVFLDTLKEGGPAMRKALDGVRPGIVMESELDLSVAAIPLHHASWAQWLEESPVPGILRNKWFERRHMMHLIHRWDLDHSSELQTAWMNGAGMLIWQNVFGSWYGWQDRDKSILRQMLPIQRRFSDHFISGEWTPLVSTSSKDLFASRWTCGQATLWTVVNRSYSPAEGFIESASSDSSHRLFDLVNGAELDHAQLKIIGRGVGALLAIPSSAVDPGLSKFLADQSERTAKASFATERVEPLPVRINRPNTQHQAPNAQSPTPNTQYPTPNTQHPTPKNQHPTLSSLPSTLYPSPSGPRTIQSDFRVRECGDYVYGAFNNLVYPELHMPRHVLREVELGGFAVAEKEVTNAEYETFLRQSGYHPKFAEGFLAHWVNGQPRAEDLQAPVVFLDLNDARAYAAWAGLRLPTEDEWQVAVETHSLPYGVVWNWTESEHTDGRTTFSFLKGGCKKPRGGSEWYADSGPKSPAFSSKLIHFWPQIDRSELISFRCASDI